MLIITLEHFEEEKYSPGLPGFDQSYTRFLDLQKAEAQTREAKIEAALEKVRSRTMGMHKADELREVVTVVVERLIDLGVILDANGAVYVPIFQIQKMSCTGLHHRISATGSYLLPYFDHPIFNDAWESDSVVMNTFLNLFNRRKNSFSNTLLNIPTIGTFRTSSRNGFFKTTSIPVLRMDRKRRHPVGHFPR
ncbi:MAG: hypothetical protein H6574_09175 [Lewinellaceae bacterium]|nr:hypothetical protein [Lewinellaceae bacterium]